MRKEFVEALLMSKQDSKLLVNIYSCRGGECFKSCQTIEKAHISIEEYNIGLEIRDKVNTDAIVKIGYSKLKKVKIMDFGELILTFLYGTIHIELVIRAENQ
jgi:hypothetical protein